MKKGTSYLLAVLTIALLGSCVESSKKYKDLKLQNATLAATNKDKNEELNNLLAELDELAAGVHAIREAENLLVAETKEAIAATGSKSKQQMSQLMSDVNALTGAIKTYRTQLARVSGDPRYPQSDQLNKLVAELQRELDRANKRIQELTKALEGMQEELALKTEELGQLTATVEELNTLTKEQAESIAEKDKVIYSGYYIIGTKKELKAANVIAKGGWFADPIVSPQAQKASGFQMLEDIRVNKSIPLDCKSAKVLSAHPKDSYALDKDPANNLLTLNIRDETAFWKQTKYVIIMK
ncbi:hypothetical protein FACS1894199_11170 [Bacteroidia bacterium]|nr:hypothetical protein FACS1894199_11170 [Bacteroidia bacterium]